MALDSAYQHREAPDYLYIFYDVAEVWALLHFNWSSSPISSRCAERLNQNESDQNVLDCSSCYINHGVCFSAQACIKEINYMVISEASGPHDPLSACQAKDQDTNKNVAIYLLSALRKLLKQTCEGPGPSCLGRVFFSLFSSSSSSQPASQRAIC